MHGQNVPRVGFEIQPYFFFSYSRADLRAVNAAKRAVTDLAVGVWHDIDQIALGDHWLSEIEAGIRQADELVLFVSNSSMRSEIVEYEIKFAESLGKKIRPIVIEELHAPLPKLLSKINYVDLSGRSWDPDIFNKIFDKVGPSVPGPTEADYAKLVKQYSVRSVWPQFSPDLLRPDGRDALILIKSHYARSLNSYGSSSPMTMNAGLVDCLLGEWDLGVDKLEAFARASNRFSGWYFYALHLHRSRAIPTLTVKVGNAAKEAISILREFGTNPLTEMLSAIYGYGFNNRSPSFLEEDLRSLARAHEANQECASEYARFYWCFKSSLRVFGPAEQAVMSFIRRNAGYG